MELLENLWENDKINVQSPFHFQELMEKIQGNLVNNSKDIILFFLENMHKELTVIKNVKQKNDNNYLDEYNFYSSLNSFIYYFKRNNKSIISEIFYGINNSQIKCLNCNSIKNNINCYNIIITPLVEINKYKKHNKNNIITIKDCFEYNQKNNDLMGYCNKCNKMANSVNNTTLITGPKVLILKLNNEKLFQYNIKLNFEEYIDINEFIYFKNTSNKYKLIGIITYFSESEKNRMNGRFLAFCKSFGDNNWYKYNDSIVNLSNFKEIKNTGIPHMLFYSAI